MGFEALFGELVRSHQGLQLQRMILLPEQFVLVALPVLLLLPLVLVYFFIKEGCVVVLANRMLMSQLALPKFLAAPRLSAPTGAELHVEAINFVQEAIQNLWVNQEPPCNRLEYILKMIDPEVGEVVGGHHVQMTLLGQPLTPKQAPKRRRKRKFQVSYGPGKSLKTGSSGFSSVHFIPPHARMSQQDMHGVNKGATDSDTSGHIYQFILLPILP